MTQHREPTHMQIAGQITKRGLALCLLALLFCLVQPGAALAGDKIFGTDSPLTKFVDFTTGPFAYLVVIVALVATVGVLALGGEFSGFSRRMPIVVVAGGIVILAQTVLGNLFGAGRAATLPPDMDIHLELNMSGHQGAPETGFPSQAKPAAETEQVGVLR